METSTENPRGIYEPKWTQYVGVDVLQIPGSRYIAIPAGRGGKDARKFDIVDTKENAYLCQLTKKETSPWLCGRAREEGLESNFQDKRGAHAS